MVTHEKDALAKALFEAFPGIPAPGPGAWTKVWQQQAENLIGAGWRVLPPDPICGCGHATADHSNDGAQACMVQVTEQGHFCSCISVWVDEEESDD